MTTLSLYSPTAAVVTLTVRPNPALLAFLRASGYTVFRSTPSK